MYRCIALLAAVVLSVIAASFAETVKFDSCSGNPETPSTCEVHQVRIVPCPESAENNPCKLKRGIPANIQFDFTPGQDMENLKAQAYWANALGDLPLLGMERDACLFTPCPVEANVQTTYNYTLTISKKFPPRNYEIRWKLWDKDVDPTFQCCFTTKIKLLK